MKDKGTDDIKGGECSARGRERRVCPCDTAHAHAFFLNSTD